MSFRGLRVFAICVVLLLCALAWRLHGAGRPLATAEAPDADAFEAFDGEVDVLTEGPSNVRVTLTAPPDGVVAPSGTIQLQGEVRVGTEDGGPNTSVVVAIDTSRSTIDTDGPGCVELDNRPERISILDCELQAALSLVDEAIADPLVGEVAFVPFEGTAEAADVVPNRDDGGPAWGDLRQVFTAPDADHDGDGTPDLFEVIRSTWVLRAGVLGGVREFTPTNVHGNPTGTWTGRAFERACEVLEQAQFPLHHIVLVADGGPNGGPTPSEILPCAAGAKVTTIAVGIADEVGCDVDPDDIGSLAEFAEAAGGRCLDVPDPADLPDVFRGLVGGTVEEVFYRVDDGPRVAVPLSGPLPFGDVGALTFDLPVADLAGTPEVCVYARGTSDGSPVTVRDCVEVVVDQAPVADAGPPQVVEEGTVVRLQASSTDVDTDPSSLLYHWELGTTRGAALPPFATEVADPSLLTLDDGEHTLRVTVSDGVLRGIDETTLTVVNVAPEVVEAEAAPALRGGVALVHGRFVDAGLTDGHVVQVDWGDGVLQALPVAVQGTGWGRFVGTHAYAVGGTYDVAVTVYDDDGGASVPSVAPVTVADPPPPGGSSRSGPPVAVWALGDAPDAVRFVGDQLVAGGRIHSEGGVALVGQDVIATGGVEHVGDLRAAGMLSASPAPAVVEAQAPPDTFDLADFAPGGEVAVGLGPYAFDHAADCVDGRWIVDAPLAPGVHHAPCDVDIVVDGAVTATLVATGRIAVASADLTWAPFHDDLSLFAGAEGVALEIGASAATLRGIVYAPAGEARLGGQSVTLDGAVMADRVSLVGTGLTLSGMPLVPGPGGTAPPPEGPVASLSPSLRFALDAPDRVLPGEAVDTVGTLSYPEASLDVPLVLGVENKGAGPLVVGEVSVGLQTLPAGGTAWVDEPHDVVAAWLGEAPGGQSLARGEAAVFAAAVSATLPADALARVLDPAQTASARLVVGSAHDGSGGGFARSYAWVRDDLRPEGGDGAVDALDVTLSTVDGVADAAAGPGERLLPGDARAFSLSGAQAPLPGRAYAEPPADYLARLDAADGRALPVFGLARGEGPSGPTLAPWGRDVALLSVPVLDASLSGPPTLRVGETATWDVLVTSRGSADAEGVTLAGEAGDVIAVAALDASSVAAGGFTEGTLTLTADADQADRLVSVEGRLVWTDAVGNAYGDAIVEQAVQVDGLPEVDATLADSLMVDADGDGFPTRGDTLRYALTVRNDGSQPLHDAVVQLPLPPELARVTGSETATVGTPTVLGAPGAETLGVMGLTVPPGAAWTMTIDLEVPTGLPGDSVLVSAQGTVTTPDGAIPTDDPGTLEVGDDTRTRILASTPELVASLQEQLVGDVHGDGQLHAADTVRLQARVFNQGRQPATDVRFELPLPGALAAVPDSVVPEQGVVVSDGTALGGPGVVVVDLGTVDALSVVELEVLATPYPVGIEPRTLSVQGLVTDAAGATVPTDDPRFPGEADPTAFVVLPGTGEGGLDLVGNPERPYPTITDVLPADGSTLVVPTDLAAALDPGDGEDVVYWQVLLRPADGPGDAVSLAEGVTAPSGPTLAALDPTRLPDGLWTVEILVVNSAYNVGLAQVGYLVDSAFKPGARRLQFLDAAIEIPGSPIQLVRTYDTLEVGRADTFGPGWRLDLVDVRVQTNGPLGAGGWGALPCEGPGGYVTSMICVDDAAKPHVVVVTWPDGRQDVFEPLGDPMPTMAGFGWLAPMRFQPTPGTGTEGSLRVAEGEEGVPYWEPTTGGLYAGIGGQDGPWDPQRFELTDAEGNVWLLDKDEGVLRVDHWQGTTVEITDEGVFHSLGPDLLWTRDADGRITSVVQPDGGVWTYRYDLDSGDLIGVVDPTGAESTFTYDEDFAHHLVAWDDDGRGAPAGEWIYDADGRLVGARDGEGVGTTDVFDLDDLTITRVGPDPDLTTVTAYDAEGRVASLAQTFPPDPAVPSATVTYTTTFAYDGEDRLVRVDHPGGGHETFAYDDHGFVAEHRGLDGVVRSTVRDDRGRVLESWLGALDDPDAVRVERIERNDRGLPTAVYGPDDTLRAESQFDGYGRPEQLVSGTGEVVTMAYDPITGFLAAMVLPAGDTVQIVSDPMGRPIAVTKDGEGTRTTTYDGLGRTLTMTDDLGGAQSFEYDDRGLVVAYLSKANRDPTGVPVVYTYDDAGRLVSKTGAGVDEQYAYDVAGRLTGVYSPGNPVVSANARHFTHDALGRMLSATQGNAMGSATSLDPDYASEVTFAYDARGMVSMTTGGGAAMPSATLSLTPDEAGRTVVSAGPARTLRYGYDALTGFLHEVEDEATSDHAGLGTFAYDWTLDGLMASLSRPNGSTTSYSHDAAKRLTEIRTSLTSGGEHVLAYAYDEVTGWPSSLTDPSGEHLYSHDVRGRLTGVDHPSSFPLGDESYTYDTVGRRTSRNGQPYGYLAAEGDRPMSAPGVDLFKYTQDGRRQEARTGAGGVYLGWQAFDQLREVKVALPGMPVPAFHQFAYDALNRRVAVRGPTYERRFVYDEAGQVRAVYDDTGALVASYVVGRGFGEVLAEVVPGLSGDPSEEEARYALRDKLGTPVAWLDEAGATYQEVHRDAFGVRAQSPSVPVPYGYTGHAEDPTGLVWGRARYLEPVHGVWLSEDPVWTEGRYSYAAQRPLTMSDSDGNSATIGFTNQANYSVCYGLGSGAFHGGLWKIKLDHVSGILHLLRSDEASFKKAIAAGAFAESLLLGLRAHTATISALQNKCVEEAFFMQPGPAIAGILLEFGVVVYGFDPRSWADWLGELS